MNKRCCYSKTIPLIGILCWGLIIGIAGCKEEKLVGGWAEKKIIADGKIDDWQNIPVKTYTDQKVSISLANNADDLYLQFRTNDPRWVRTIKRSGLTIYVDNRGKKEKSFFIKYVGGPSNEALRGMVCRDGERSGDFSPSNLAGKNMQFEEKKDELTCFVKDRIIEKPIPIDGKEGPAAAFDTSYGFYTYEFVIPLRQSTVRDYGIDALPGSKISIGLVWGGMGEMERGEMGRGGGPSGGGGGGFPGGGGGMPPGGGMGGGPGGGMGGPPGGGRGGGDMPSEQEVWFKTVLHSSASDMAVKK